LRRHRPVVSDIAHDRACLESAIAVFRLAAARQQLGKDPKTAADFERVPDALRARMESFYTEREIRHIELVAAVMDVVNRSANTYEAMLSRLRGKPGEKTRIIDEIFFSSVFLTVAPPLVLLLARYSERSFGDTTRSLVGYLQGHYAQKATRPTTGSD